MKFATIVRRIDSEGSASDRSDLFVLAESLWQNDVRVNYSAPHDSARCRPGPVLATSHSRQDRSWPTLRSSSTKAPMILGAWRERFATIDEFRKNVGLD